MGNLISKRTLIFLSIEFVLIAMSFKFSYLLNATIVLIVIYIIYNYFIRSMLNKNIYKGEEIYSFKSKVNWSNILGYFFAFGVYIYNVISRYGYNYVYGQYIQEYSLNDRIYRAISDEGILLIISVIIYLLLIFIEMKSGKSNIIFYDKGIITSYGEFIKYEDIYEIERREFDLKAIYNVKVKSYLGSMEFFDELDKDNKVQEILGIKMKSLKDIG